MHHFTYDTLTAIAEKSWHESNGELASAYKDKAHFRICLERFYVLVANRTCQQWNMRYGKGFSAQDRADSFPLAKELPYTPIHSTTIKKLLGSFSRDGKSVRAPYRPIRDILIVHNIIECRGYSTGIENLIDAHSTPYRLTAHFMSEVIKSLKVKRLNVFSAFNAYLPNPRHTQKIVNAKELYNSLTPIGHIRVILPKKWESQLSPFEWFQFNDELTLRKLILGLRRFKEQTRKPATFKNGRLYDWFVKCPHAFRECLFIGRKHYREIIDCHSGFVWLLAIAGYKQKSIPKDECEKLIAHCFRGTFYEDISERTFISKNDKKEVKTTFMRLMNTDTKGTNYLINKGDRLLGLIQSNMNCLYPKWMGYLGNLKLRMSRDGKGIVHSTSSMEEQFIIEKTIERMSSKGYRNLRRVHDAIYGLDSIDDAEEIMLGVVHDTLDLN